MKMSRSITRPPIFFTMVLLLFGGSLAKAVPTNSLWSQGNITSANGTNGSSTNPQSIEANSQAYSPSVSAPQSESGSAPVDGSLSSELQAPIGPVPENPIQQDGNVFMPILNQDGVAVSPSNSDSEFKKWRLRPTFGVGYAYDDNITISHTNPIGTGIGSISGGLAFDYGDYLDKKNTFLTSSYMGTGYLFSQTPQYNCYNQYASLTAQYRWERLFARLESRYYNINAPQLDVGSFTSRQVLEDVLSLSSTSIR
jgi:hypothetical protein